MMICKFVMCKCPGCKCADFFLCEDSVDLKIWKFGKVTNKQPAKIKAICLSAHLQLHIRTLSP